MKQTLFSIALVLSSIALAAQELSPTVISPGGGESQIQGIKLSWTLGELATRSSETGQNIYTEGYHQPMLTFEKVGIDEVVSFIPDVSGHDLQEVAVRPNPVNSVVHMDFTTPLDTDAVLNIYNAQGQLVHSSRLARGTNSESFNVEHLSPGMYTLVCVEDRRLVTAPYRIIKI